jgi:peptidoglycan-N-acetylglucosamine deacetylase
LHPLDFLGCEDVPELAFFPAMNQPSYKKLRVLKRAIQMLADQFDVRTVGQHAQLVSGKLPTLDPQERTPALNGLPTR